MTQQPGRSGGEGCSRHPDRQSFVLCQRCARTVCPACQTPAPVGVICPDCLRAAAPARARRAGVLRGAALSSAPVSYGIIALTVAVFLAQLLLGLVLSGRDPVAGLLLFNSRFLEGVGAAGFQPWRMLTASLVHGGFLHLLFNMLTLWIFGRALEEVYGPRRLLAVWIVSVLGSSLAVLLLSPGVSVVGASGGVFGLMGAYFTVMRRARMDTRTLVILIGLNLAAGFLLPGISWQAHVGGLLTGAACGALLHRDLARPGGFGPFAWLTLALGALLAGAAVFFGLR